jgi:hypothetical protein
MCIHKSGTKWLAEDPCQLPLNVVASIGSASCQHRVNITLTCVLDARSAMLPLAHSACWNAGCVLTKVVRPTALPTLLMAVSSRKCDGKRGVRNSHDTHTVYSTDVVKRKRCRCAVQQNAVQQEAVQQQSEHQYTLS